MDLNSAFGDHVPPLQGYGAYQPTVAKTFPAPAGSFGRTASAIQIPKARLSVQDSSLGWYMKGRQPSNQSFNSRCLNGFLYGGQKQSDLKGVGLELGSQLRDDDFEKLLFATGNDKPSSCMTEATAEESGNALCPLWLSTTVRTVGPIEHEARKHCGSATTASNGSGYSSRCFPDENDMALNRGSDGFSEDPIDAMGAQYLTSRIDEDKNFDAQSAETTGTYQAEDCNTECVEGLQQADDWNLSHQNFWSVSPPDSIDFERQSDSTTRSVSAGPALHSLSGKAELALKSDRQNQFDSTSDFACVPQDRGREHPFETLEALEKSKLAMRWKEKILNLRCRENSLEVLKPLIKILETIKDPANYLWLIKQTGFMSVSFVHLPNKIHMRVLDRLDSIVQHDRDHANQVLNILFDPFEKKDESYVANYLSQCIYDHVDNIMTDRNDEAIQLGKSIIMILAHVVELGLCSRVLDKMLKITVRSHDRWEKKKTSFFVQLLSPEKHISEMSENRYRRHRIYGIPVPKGAVPLYRTIYLQHIRQLMEFAELNLIEKMKIHGARERVHELFDKPWWRVKKLEKHVAGKLDYCPSSPDCRKRAVTMTSAYSNSVSDDDVNLIDL